MAKSESSVSVQKSVTGQASHSRAFFLELVINLLLFTLCAAICLQIFVMATLRSRESSALAQAGLKAQTVAEVFKARGGDLYAVSEAIGGEATDAALVFYYDPDWLPASKETATFTLECRLSSETDLRAARITALRGDEEIYAIQVSKYAPEGGGTL